MHLISVTNKKLTNKIKIFIIHLFHSICVDNQHILAASIIKSFKYIKLNVQIHLNLWGSQLLQKNNK